MKNFFFSTEVPAQLTRVHADPVGRWMQIPHSGIVRPAYVLLAGECLRIADGLLPAKGSRLLVKYGAAHQALSADGATLAIAIVVDDESRMLVELTVAAGEAGWDPREITIDISPFSGKSCALRLQVGAGPGGQSDGDWVAIYELAVAGVEHLPSVRARAFHRERSENELAHFSSVYAHQIYQQGSTADNKQSSQAVTASTCRQLTDLVGHRLSKSGEAASASMESVNFAEPDILPLHLRDAYHYTHHLLSTQLHAHAPNFNRRLLDRSEKHPLRILSLCSGAARIEASLAANAGISTHWTLMDLSEPLLRSAAAGFPDGIIPDLIVGDLNQVQDFGQRFDVILCVSGLHHIVELERVIAFIQGALVEDGEFWSIGEAIGRNGNRLWSSDYAVANAFFRSLPEGLRFNRSSDSTDSELPDIDCSNATFEGIRSEDIEPLLSRYLEPVDVYRRNCFLWRLVNLAYVENYDLANPGHVDWLQRAVAAELAHFRAGGCPTELHGVFRRRSA